MRVREFSIGAAARQSGVKVPTIRYYEQIGLLRSIARGESNRRTYDHADLRRLAFIRHARELGFDLEAIRTLLNLQDDPDQSCERADAVAKARLADVERRLKSLRLLHAELEKMVLECASGRVGECRVIETLADDGHQHGPLAG